MWPRNEPSCSTNAQPRPSAGSHSSKPSQKNSTLGAIARCMSPVNPTLDRDEPETAHAVWFELDEARSDQVHILQGKQIHLHDPPPTHRRCDRSTGLAKHRTSYLLFRTLREYGRTQRPTTTHRSAPDTKAGTVEMVRRQTSAEGALST